MADTPLTHAQVVAAIPDNSVAAITEKSVRTALLGALMAPSPAGYDATYAYFANELVWTNAGLFLSIVNMPAGTPTSNTSAWVLVAAPPVTATTANTALTNANTALGAVWPVTRQTVVPTSGQTVQLTADLTIIKPAGILISLTLAFPANPNDGKRIGFVVAAFSISTLTLSPAPVPVSGIGAVPAASFVYDAASTSWVRCT